MHDKLYADPLTTLMFILFYSVSLFAAYRRGHLVMKKKCSQMINSLHRLYFAEMSGENKLLDFLEDIEKNSYWEIST